MTRLRRPALLCGGVALLLLLLWLGVRAVTGYSAYRGASAQLQSLEASAELDPATLTVSDIGRIESDLRELKRHLGRLDHATSIPFGGDYLVSRLPWIGPRYVAGRDLVRIGELLSTAGASSASVLREVLIGFETAGISREIAPPGPTWLDALARRQSTLATAAQQIDEARDLKSHLNAAVLPAAAQSRLAQLDRVLGRADLRFQTLVQEEFPVLQSALGGERPVRYLVLFQNPAELRPSGGFPGTTALVTIDRGQLRGYEFSDIKTINNDYLAHDHAPVPQPPALARYAPEKELAIFDATWWPDFPRSAATVMAMYAASARPVIDGVIVVDPVIVRELLGITGPVTVEVGGEPREITAGNVIAEIEQQQRRVYRGLEPEAAHKDLLALIGQEILQRLKTADRGLLRQAFEVVRQGAGRRDLQIYHASHDIQAEIERQNWAGSLIPDPNIPTLAVTFANVAFGKTSLRMTPSYDLQIGPAQGGMRQVTLRLSMANNGPAEDDPLFGGFQRWWVDVYLPSGSQVSSSTSNAAATSDAPNGGSYVIELSPGEVREMTMVFFVPDTNELLLRRQPGVKPGQVDFNVAGSTCEAASSFLLVEDITLHLASDACRS